MALRFQHSNQPWRKTVHTLVCICVVLSHVFSFLAMTPQVVQAATPSIQKVGPTTSEVTPQKPMSAARRSVAARPATLLAQAVASDDGEMTATNVLTVTKTISGAGTGPFNITVTGPSGVISTTTINGGETKLFTGLASGIYTVTESIPVGWTTVYTATASSGSATGGSSNAVVTLQNANTATLATTPITGMVFRDFNSDGLITANGVITDTGVPSVTVTAYDKNGSSVGSVTTASDGTYTLNPTGDGPYRVEFTNLPSRYEPTTHGGGNGTSTQFVDTAGGASDVNLGINQPCDYCQDNPLLATNLYRMGNHVPLSGTVYVLSYNYLRNIDGNINGTTGAGATYTPQRPLPTQLAANADVGATWGIVYNNTARRIYAAAYLKRKTQFGALSGESTGAIYTIDPTGASSPSLFVDLNSIFGAGTAGANPHPTATTNFLNDTATRDLIGKVGLGDIDLSADNRLLYAINLADRKLYAIPTTGALNNSTIQRYDLPTTALPTTAGVCASSDVRPFGLGLDNTGLVYVGGVCSGETQGHAYITAYVWRFDPSVASFTLVLSAPLNFSRNQFFAGYGPFVADFRGWTPPDETVTQYPQPMLSNIVFDGDDMVLGFRDRFGDQIPADGKMPSDSPFPRGYGDVLRACPGGLGWQLESNGSCGGVTTLGANNAAGQTTPQTFGNYGPGGGEFYYQDVAGDNENSREVGVGGLAHAGGYPIITTAYDPVRFNDAMTGTFTTINGGGLQVYNNISGQQIGAYELYSDADVRPTGTTFDTFGKTSGMGDVELLCDPAPIEIGNRVWDDLNGDGIQDPGEPGLNGLTVSLQSPTNTVTAVTSGDGNYYFNVSRTTAYTLTITPPTGYTATLANEDSVDGTSASSNHAISDTRDSDAVLVGGLATIYYTTGDAGQNNHGLDFGFTQPVSGQVDILNIAPIPVPDPGGFSISKEIATTDGNEPVVSGSFDVVVSCPGVSGYPAILSLDADGTPVAVGNLAAGTICTFSEDLLTLPAAPTGYTWVNAQFSPASITIASNITATVAAINTLAPQPTPPTNVLTVTKTISGTGSGPFDITVTGPNGVISTTTINGGQTKLFTGLASGVYTVTEATPTGWTTVYTATPGTGGSSNAVVTLQNANTATLATTPITGTVFRDFNSDGQITANGVTTDTGVSGVTVTAYDKNGNAVGSAASAADGTYTINPTSAGPYRVEFSNLPAGYEPTTHSTVGGTSTQFVTTSGGTSDVNFGVNYPTDYCQNNPSLCTNLLINGGLNATAPTDTLISFGYGYSNTTPLPTALASKLEVGSTWGLAYARTSGTLYSAAFLKRHVGLGPDGLGAIYATSVKAGGTSLFANLATQGVDVGTVASNSLRALGAPNAPSNDATVFDQIGKVGLGGIAISDDERILYVTSLNDKQLYALTVPGGNVVGRYTIPDPGCVGGAWRPFATKFWRGDVFVGGVCDAQTSQAASDLRAYVMRFTPGANTFGAVIDFALDYPKGYAGALSCSANTGWYPWVSTLPASCYTFGSALFYVWPQPILANIEFDIDGSLILGFADRMAHQVGFDNYPLTGTTLERGTSGGDILRVYNNNGVYALENNGSTGPLTTAGAGDVEGPGGGEFYFEDNFGPAHRETALGGLALFPGSGQVAANAMDPFNYDQNGTYWFDNTTGSASRKYQIYQSNAFNPSTFGKSSGLGDLELLCDAAPVEIGNRVWDDLNGDGIQDPGEPGLNGLTVSLQSPTNTVTAVTSGDGNYYFNVSRTTAYTLTVTPPSGYSVTAANAAALNGAGVSSNHAISDTRDSDAVLVGGSATIYYMTGSAGQNNHGLDFGFTSPAKGQADILNIAPVKIGNRLWIESDNDGDATTGTVTPVVGQVVTATSSSGTVYTTTTDSNGLYTITVPVNGVYTVTTATPAGTVASTVIATIANDANATANNDKNHVNTGTPVTVGTTDNLSVDFGFHPQPVSLGNLVWYDTNNNGAVNTGEYGVANAQVQLYQDSNGDGVFSTGDTLISTTTTSASGFYSFTNLLPTTGISTTYLVVIPSTNFTAGGALTYYQSSTGSVNADNSMNSQDNGIDGTLNANATGGYVASRAISLTVGTQPADDGDTSLTNPLTASTGVTDTLANPSNTNWTLDFGFYKLTLGNQIWYDSNNNGLYEPSNGENGLQGITVTLLSGGAPVLTTTTDANGVYTFTGLISGTYQVRILAPSNLVSSQDTANSSATSNADSNDKGPGTTGQVITSQPFPLIAGNPSGAIMVSNPTATTFNPTLDFGLIQFVEIGNRLWIESDNDGDATTGSTSPVVGQIVTATSGTGAVYTATTDANGLYTITVPANDVYTVTTSTPVGTVPSTVITSVANDSNAAANNDKNHRNTGTVVSVKTTDNLSVDFGFNTPLAQFGDRVWLESDTDGLASTGVITPMAGLTITATDSQGVAHTTTTDVAGYYSFTLVAGAYTVTYGTVPASYGTVMPSSTPGGNSEGGNAGLYAESGDPDQSHSNGTSVTVASGEANWHIDFAFYPLVKIGNHLWIESDSDGDASTGTVIPVANQVVTATSTSGMVYTATTDVNGLYTITVPGNDIYTVTTGTPLGTVPSTISTNVADDANAATYNDNNHASTGTTVTVVTTDNLSVDFGFHAPLAQFGDRVWLESDTDGNANTGSITPVSGMVITATAGANVYTTTTDAAGYYSFTLPAGSYVVSYGSVPASYGTVMPSSTPGGNSESGNAGLYAESGDPDQSHSNGTTVTVADGQANWHIDFAFTPVLVKIGDRLWIESDRDGDATTGIVTPVVNQLVTVTSSSGVVYTTTTDAQGLYTITVPANGVYTVTTGTPVGTTPSTVITNVADDGNATANNDKNHAATGTTVTAVTTDNLSVDFGFHWLTNSLGNRLWVDDGAGVTANRDNGVVDSGEPAVPQGVVLELLDITGTVRLTTTTDSSGYYRFDKLAAGSYQVRIPASEFATNGKLYGYASSTGQTTTFAALYNNVDHGDDTEFNGVKSAIVTLGASNPTGEADNGATSVGTNGPDGDAYDNLTVDFGFVPQATFGNFVWIESDTDGNANTGTITPVGGMVITATDGLNTYTTVTDPNGYYTFTVPTGVYTVTYGNVPASYSAVVPSATPNGGTAEKNNLGTDQQSRPNNTVVTLVPGDNIPTIDFGFHAPLAQFGDRVWIESDTDGNASTGTITPVAGVTITATDSSGVAHTTTTDATGYYSFTLPVGTYTVTYGVVPASYGVTTPSSTPGGNSEAGKAGLYAENGNPDQSHVNGTTVTVGDGQANWHIDFAFHNLVEIGNRLWIEDDTDGDATTGTVTPVVGQVVTVTSGSGTVYTTTTDVNGLYTVTVPANATYTVTTATPKDKTPSVFSGTPGDNQSHTPTGTTVTVGSMNDLTIDFGFHAPLAQFGDRVWLESDTDGLVGTGVITPVAGLVITATDGTHIYTTSTNATGYYSFAVPAGVYIVTYGAVPASYGITTPSATPGANNESGNAGSYQQNSAPDQSHSNGTTVTVNAGEANWHIDFAFNQPPPPVTYSLGNRLWIDDGAGNASQSNNGQVDSNEKPVPSGVLVELLDGNARPVLVNGQPATTTTDANGYYRFDNLAAGQYQVCVAANNFAAGGKLFGYVSSNGQNTDFSSAGNNHDHGDNPINPAIDGVKSMLVTLNASNPTGDVDNSATGNASHGPNGDRNDNLTVDFGFFIPASIGNYVWLDKDVDGVQDTGEPAVPGVAVALFKADGSPATDVNGQLVAPQTTDANGTYQFTNLPPGAYYIQFTPPANYFISPQDQGADEAVDSDVNPTTGKTAVKTLSSGEQDISWDLGLYQGAALGNYVWDDKNGNGLQDAGEPGLPAVTVTLYNSTNTAVATTQTDAQGYYGFSSLTPGDYSIQFTTPTGYVPTRPNQGSDDAIDSDVVNGHTTVTTLTNDEHDTTCDAGFTAPATIRSYVWNDGTKETADGIKTPEELGVPGVTIILLDVTGQEITHTVTDQAGFFQFTNVVPGAYIIKFVTPTDTEFTQVVPNANDNSTANPTTGETIVVTLQPGQVAISWNAGLVSVPTALDTESEPSRNTINIYLPDIKNEAQAAEGRSGFKKPRLTPKPQTMDQPQTLDQIVAE